MIKKIFRTINRWLDKLGSSLIAGISTRDYITNSSFKDDAKNLNSDWAVVNKDMKKVLDRYEHSRYKI